MTFLLLAISCSVLLGFIFKLFVRWQIDIFQAIVFNYFTCVLFGWGHLGHFPVTSSTFQAPWLPYALLLGFVFISGFNTAAMTVRFFGVTISQVMQKMSILLSVPFAVLVFQESAGWAKAFGFLLALAGIVLVNYPITLSNTKQGRLGFGLWWIPLVTWLLAGVIEVVFLIVQYRGLADMNDPSFIITVFGTAGLIGFLMAVWGWLFGKLRFAWRNVLGGILLGIPNYGSMLFMLWALADGLEGSVVFPVTNVGIIICTAFGAVLLFKEHISKLNWFGVSLAAIAILLMAW